MARRDSERLREAGRRLAELRQELGLSQKALAERLGRPPSWVGKLELAEHRLDLADLALIAEALGLPPGELVERLLSRTGDP